MLPPIVGLGTKIEKSELERLSLLLLRRIQQIWHGYRKGRNTNNDRQPPIEKGTPRMPWCDSMKYKIVTETVFPERSINIDENTPSFVNG